MGYVMLLKQRCWVEDLAQIEAGVRPIALSIAQKVRILAPIISSVDSFLGLVTTLMAVVLILAHRRIQR